MTISCAGAASCSETIVNGVVTAVTMDGQGTYTITALGTLSFDPLATFEGTARPVTYTVSDNFNQSVSTTYTPTVLPPAPAAAEPDVSSGEIGQLQTILPLGNDSPTQGQTFVNSTLFLCDPDSSPAEQSPNCTLLFYEFADGSYTVNTASGTVDFQPTATFSGVAMAISYQISDTANSTVSSTITPTVTEKLVILAPPPPPPIAQPAPPVVEESVALPPKALQDRKTGPMNRAILFNPSANDLAGTWPLIPVSTTICDGICGAVRIDGSAQSIKTRQGVWSIVAGSHRVKFTPNWNWHGTATIDYMIVDQFGQKAMSKIIAVIPPPKLAAQLVYTAFGSATEVPAVVPNKTPAVLRERDFVATIRAPRLGKNWKHDIFEGESVERVLNKLGLGHYSMTQLPGEAGNFAVAGHRFGAGGIFRDIHTFRKGDIVEVTTSEGTFKYRFLQKKLVKPTEVGVLLPKPKGLTAKIQSDSILTLQTCTGATMSDNRLIVWFELIG